MDLKKRIMSDLTAAMKAKDINRISTLRMVKTAIINKQIEKGSVKNELSDDEIIKILQTLIKQRREAIEQYRKVGREDLATKEENEIEIIEEYLPQPASIEEIKSIIEEAIRETHASSIKDMGSVMKIAISRLSGKTFDGKVVNQMVRERLQLNR